MLLQRSFIAFMARELAHRLGKESCEIPNEAAVREAFEILIVDELSLEDEINAEARELLNQYGDYMRQQRIPYQEMFQKVKRQILNERKVISAQARGSGDREMKLSRDKINELSHKLAARLPRILGVRMKKRWNDVRLDIVEILRDLLAREEAVDKAAHKKISSQQREIPEGSEEWTLLYRRYYDEEMKRYGIDLSPV
jgi:hypothetical protein